MRYIGIIILLVLCLTLLLLTGCMINTVTPEIASGNLENQEDINQSSNNSQSSSTGSIYESATVESATNPSTNNPNSNNYQNPSTDPVEEPATEDLGTGEADTTKPVITGSRDPLPNSFGWNNTDVTVSFSCADTGPVQSGIDVNTVAGETVTTEGKDQSVTNTGICADAAGNNADPVTVSNINIDKTPPEVTITLPGTGEYALNQSITATWSATDALSGVVSPVSGTVSIDTSSVGTKTFTLPAGTATDKAGNSSLKVTKSYSVIADTENPEMIYPQQWATGDGTAENPWANDCIKKALNFMPSGGTIFLKAGYYKLDTTLWDTTGTKSYSIIGEGMGRTILVTNMTTDVGIYITGVDHCKLKGFTLDASSQNANTNCGITVGSSDYLIIEDVEVKNSGQTGINLGKNNYTSLNNIYAHNNYSHGIHANTSTVLGTNTHNNYRNIYSWSNGHSGFDDYGNAANPTEPHYNVYDNIQCWDNTKHGIAICNQTDGVISNSFVSDNAERGMYLHTIEDFNIHDCVVNINTLTQLSLYNSKNINFTDVIVKNSDAGAGGILIKNTSDIKFTTCQSYDDRSILLQSYGLLLLETNTGISLLNCKLTPNKLGDIYNPNGVAVKVITEKMLAKF